MGFQVSRLTRLEIISTLRAPDVLRLLDTLKGSYYANPSCDTPEVTPSQRQAHASYLRNNIWPSEDDCPGFEEDVKALARFMTQTGRLLAKACDNLVAQHSNSSSVEEMIASSRCSKARLLHYYPPEGQVVSLGRSWSQAKSGNDSAKADSWCVKTAHRITAKQSIQTHGIG